MGMTDVFSMFVMETYKIGRSLLNSHCSFQGAAVAADPATGEVVERPEGYEPPVMDTV
jgi:hypothetical protein